MNNDLPTIANDDANDSLPNIQLERFAAAFHTDVQLFRNDRLVAAWPKHTYAVNLAHALINPHLRDSLGTEPVFHVFSTDLFMAGCVLLPDDNRYLIIGPATPAIPTRTQTARLFMELGIDHDLLDGAMPHMRLLPHRSPSDFVLMINLLAAMVRHDETQSVKIQYQGLATTSGDVPSPPTVLPLIDSYPIVEVGAMIRDGRPQDLVSFLENPADHLDPHGLQHASATDLRTLKNIAIAAAPQAATYAKAGGLDSDTCSGLVDYYIQRFEHIDEYARLTEELVTMLADFARRVADVQLPPHCSAMITRACQLIQTHRAERISSSTIASRLGVSVGYLQQRFKRETGTTLAAYIRERKVREACFLLESSDLTLARIAQQLSYTSQQQFQTTFRQVTGITPKHYRDEHRRPHTRLPLSNRNNRTGATR